jgi:hypothetical protein
VPVARLIVTADRAGAQLGDAFAYFDRARLAHSDPEVRAAQLAARQVLYAYVEDLWRDIDRSGELRGTDGKYEAIAEVRLLAGMLRGSAFEAVYGPQDEG